MWNCIVCNVTIVSQFWLTINTKLLNFLELIHQTLIAFLIHPLLYL